MVFYHFAESIDKLVINVKEVKPQIMTVVPRLVEKVYDKIVDKSCSWWFENQNFLLGIVIA